MTPIITLLTDFGTADYFFGAVKGAILTVNPEARIVDITHDVPSHDIESAAFTLLAGYSAFPAGTVHVAVVDPGVGSSRRGIVVRTGGHLFVGPDNGIFSYVMEGVEESEVFHLDQSRFFRQPVSQTFNGRDVFAPVAAALSNGNKLEELGTRITDCVRLPPLKPTSASGDINARIIHIDRFGNCVTNISRQELSSEMISAGIELQINGMTVKQFRNFFAEEVGGAERLFAIWGSAGFLEIAAMNDSAANLLKAKRGDMVAMRSVPPAVAGGLSG